MQRPSLSDIEYSRRKRTTKGDEFLRIMNMSIPWDEWVAYSDISAKMWRFFRNSRSFDKTADIEALYSVVP
jgi:hypothetical protein